MEESPRPPTYPVRSFVEQHAWALLTLIPFIVVFLRVSVVSHFELSSAQVIVRDVAPVPLVLGTLLPLVPTVAAAIGTLVLWFVVRRPSTHRLVTAWLTLLAIALFTFLDWRILAILVVAFGLSALVSWQLGIRWMTFWRTAAALVAGVVLPATAIFATLSDRPWLPAERITTASEQVIVGYVLSESLVWTTILSDRDRKVTRVRNADVKGRVICATSEDRTDSLLAIILQGREPNYARCVPSTTKEPSG
jgi:hypothetical protein